MISGRVNAFLEATLPVVLQTPDGASFEIEAVIDTGFNGALTLPPDLIHALELPFRRQGRALLGDGSVVDLDIHEATIVWDGRARRISVDSADTEPLLGMALLYGCSITIEVVEAGEVLVAPLPVS